MEQLMLFDDNTDGNDLFHQENDEAMIGCRHAYTEKRKSGRIVAWVTGISGSGRREYAMLQRDLAAANGRHLEILDGAYWMRKVIHENGRGVKWGNILNLRADDLKEIRRLAYGKICRIIDENPSTDFAVLSHAVFDRHNTLKLGYDPSFFSEEHPDICINMLNHHSEIVRELGKREGWKDENLSRERIVRWTCEELNETKNMADRMNVPWYAIPRFMSPTTLFMLLYHPERPWLYYAQPMTHANSRSYEDADRFYLGFLARMFAATNPKGYEILEEVYDGGTCAFTDCRDTEFFVQQNDIVIGDHPGPDGFNKGLMSLADDFGLEPAQKEKLMEYAGRKGPVPSVGVSIEVAEARRSGKDSFVVWPTANNDVYCSPFIRSNAEVFRTRGELKKALAERYGQPLDITIPDYVVADSLKPFMDRQLPEGAYLLG